MKKRGKTKKRKMLDAMHFICWLVIPMATLLMLIAEAIGLYRFTNQNLIIICISLGVVLLPFFSEIKIKDLSVKRNGSESNRTK